MTDWSDLLSQVFPGKRIYGKFQIEPARLLLEEKRIDQTLSNFWGVPYALGRRTANVNFGAVASSYLVFDEFHLFPPEGALKTTLGLPTKRRRR